MPNFSSEQERRTNSIHTKAQSKYHLSKDKMVSRVGTGRPFLVRAHRTWSFSLYLLVCRVVNFCVILCGIAVSSFAAYRLCENFLIRVVDSPLVHFLLGNLMIFMFSREIRVKMMRNILSEDIRRYLFEKSLVDVIREFSLFIHAVTLIIASGILSEEEFLRLADALPAEYHSLRRPGLIRFLPESVKMMLVDRDMSIYARERNSDGASESESDDDNASSDDYGHTMEETEIEMEANGMPTATSMVDSRLNRYTDFDSDESALYRQLYNEDLDHRIFEADVRDVRVMTVEATEVRSDRSGSSSAGTILPGHLLPRIHTNNTSRTRVNDSTFSIQQVLVDIGRTRVSDAWGLTQRSFSNFIEYLLTGGDIPDYQLIGAVVGIGAAGTFCNVLSERFASYFTSRHGGDQEHRLSVAYPASTVLRGIAPVFYTFAIASGGMYVARIIRRYDINGVCDRAVLRPLFQVISSTHQNIVNSYRRLHRSYTPTTLHVAALMSTLCLLIAWRMRSHFRQWRWLIAIFVNRLKQKVVDAVTDSGMAILGNVSNN